MYRSHSTTSRFDDMLRAFLIPSPRDAGFTLPLFLHLTVMLFNSPAEIDQATPQLANETDGVHKIFDGAVFPCGRIIHNRLVKVYLHNPGYT